MSPLRDHLRPNQNLPLDGDPVELTRLLCDIESVSGNEQAIADAVEAALRRLDHLQVTRHGDAVVARTELGRSERVVLAGHLDTVPLTATPNLPTRVEGDRLVGRGTCDMKGGVAVQLAVAALLPNPSRDITFIFYDNEEVESTLNGLGRIARTAPELLVADFAVLLEPTTGLVEGGCNGTLRVEVTTIGKAAHAARAWMGSNAIHSASTVLGRLTAYQTQDVEVEGLVYRESLNAVAITGGIAGNVIPDRCVVEVNYRFAPSKTPADAERHLRELFTDLDVRVTDAAPGARPGLDQPIARAFVDAIGAEPKPKFGWTDVARFSELGVPAVNFGPGDPLKAHADDEYVEGSEIRECVRALTTWLG